MEKSIFHTHRDGEEIDYWDPVVSTSQGSLAEERRTSTGRLGKDRKEFKKVQKLNREFRLSLHDVFNCPITVDSSNGKRSDGSSLIEERLSHLGARYPNVPGLGIYVSGLSRLEQDTRINSEGKTKRVGPQTGKKIFSLLFWISSKPDLACYYKFILLNKIGKLVLNQNIKGKWMQNSTTILSMLGMNEVAYMFGEGILQNKSAIRDCLKEGEKLSQNIYIQFYENTNPYNPKVRRRGYARGSPVRPGSSKKAIAAANSSLEYLTESGYLINQEGGGYEMSEKKIDTEELLFEIFSNSLKTFKLIQEEELERIRQRGRPKSKIQPAGEEELSSKENSPTQ